MLLMFELFIFIKQIQVSTNTDWKGYLYEVMWVKLYI